MNNFPLFLQACADDKSVILSAAPHYDILTGRWTAIALVNGEPCLIDMRLARDVEAAQACR